MSTHNISFHLEIRKILSFLVEKKKKIFLVEKKKVPYLELLYP